MNLELAEQELSAKNRKFGIKRMRKRFHKPKKSHRGNITKHAKTEVTAHHKPHFMAPMQKSKIDVSYLPDPEQPDVLVREDAFDGMEEDQFFNYLSEVSPEMSMEEYDQLSAKRKERKAAKFESKQAKKAAKTEKKQSKADLRRAKGEAKIIKAQKKGKTSFKDVTSGIVDVVGSVSGAVKGIKGGGDDGSDAAAMDVPETTGGEKIMGMPKNAVLIGGGVLGLGLIYMLTKGKKNNLGK